MQGGSVRHPGVERNHSRCGSGKPKCDVKSISPTLEAQTPFTIFGRGGASWTSLGAGAFTSVGFARVKTLSGSGTPSGLAIFGARQNGVLVSEATVPAVTPVQSGRIYAEIGDSVDTGLAIANPS